MKEKLLTIAVKNAKKQYGDIIKKEIMIRLNEEIETLNDYLELIYQAYLVVTEIKKEGAILISNNLMNNSLLFYFLGLTSINPLPRHTYCPKCHIFSYGKRKNLQCDLCTSTLKEDGYNLPFDLLKNEIEKEGLVFRYASSKKYLDIEIIKFYPSDLIKLAEKMMINQKEIEQFDEERHAKEVISCFDKCFYIQHYKKHSFFSFSPFVGIDELDEEAFMTLSKHYKINDYPSFTKMVEMIHGSNVIDSNILYLSKDDINMTITSKDELYLSLLNKGLNKDEVLLMVKDTRIDKSGHLAKYLEDKLIDLGVEDNFVSFLKEISFLFLKGVMANYTKLSLLLGYIFLHDPLRYYEAYFSFYPELIKEIKNNNDYMKGLEKYLHTDKENFYLGIIDLIERGFDPKDVM